MFKRSVLFFILLILLSCNSDRVSHSGQSLRPMDTWVYRTVLDEMPRMLFAALHRDLYVAYDTQKAKLYKAWKGVVNFQGAVYDGAHGPQPTTVGDAYMIDHSGEDVWKLVSAGSDQAVQIDYKGHGFVDGSLELGVALGRLLSRLARSPGDNTAIRHHEILLHETTGGLSSVTMENFGAGTNSHLY